MKSYKSKIISIKTSKQKLDYLYKCNKESARVWNECVRLSKELWKSEQKYVDQKYLQDRIKGEFSNIIPAHNMQITIKKYMSAIKGIQNARKSGRKDLKYPWKQKKNYNTIWDTLTFKIDYDKNLIRLSRPRCFTQIINGKQKANPLMIHCKDIPKNVVYIELKYDNGLKLALNYWVDEEYKQIESNNISSIDLGEIHSITSVDNFGNNLIITGRKIRSEQRFRNKELGKLNRKLSKCKKGSRNYKKYRKTITKLLSKSNAKMNNNLNKTAKMYTDYILINDIKTVVVGDLSKFNMNLKSRRNKQGNKQKLVQWIHGQLLNKLKYKLEPFGVDIVEISEAYTSQTCPCCGNKYKPIGRNYICNACGYEIHRDVLGAYNILSKYVNDGKIKPLDIKLKELKYLRIDC